MARQNLLLTILSFKIKIAFDNAVDINIVLLDKTGTLTFGQREMIQFRTTSEGSKEDYIRYLYLSSIEDSTQAKYNIICHK